ncbi:MAG: lysoplasmalogenase [Actinobacteria bacterium]|nr:lysoplasmalogenase [Actinomycetota bacterium]
MTSFTWWMLGAAGAFAAVDWVAVGRDRRRLEQLAKPLATSLLLAVAVALEPTDPVQRAVFVIAVAASLVGDVALMFDRFLPGLGSFLVAHLAYVAGFVARDVTPGLAAVGLIAVAVVVVPLGARILTAVRRGPERSFAVPVAVYIVVIAGMAVAAIGAGVPLGIVGAITFLVSDAIIAWNRFVEELSWGPVTIMVTYHLAQGALVVSLTT